MNLQDAKTNLQNAEGTLEDMRTLRGEHEAFLAATIDFLRTTQSAFEYVEDSWGGHNGGEPNDQLLHWLFEIVSGSRHTKKPQLSHADVEVGRSPSDFPEDVDILLKFNDEGHAYYFPVGRDGQEDIPNKHRRITVCEIAEIILKELRVKIRHKADGEPIKSRSPLENEEQRD